MPSDTIWSSASTSPIQSNSLLSANSYNKNSFKSVLNQVDSDVARFLSNTNPLDPLSSDRRFSFNDGSDIEDDFFGLKRGALSAITAPVGGNNHHHHHHNNNNNSNTSQLMETESILVPLQLVVGLQADIHLKRVFYKNLPMLVMQRGKLNWVNCLWTVQEELVSTTTGMVLVLLMRI